MLLFILFGDIQNQRIQEQLSGLNCTFYLRPSCEWRIIKIASLTILFEMLLHLIWDYQIELNYQNKFQQNQYSCFIQYFCQWHNGGLLQLQFGQLEIIQSLFLFMKQVDKICIKITLKSQKERELYRKRQEKYIEGTPKIILGKAEPNTQELWLDELKIEPIVKLKEYNNTEKAYSYVKTIVTACIALTNHYGYFIINENMIFFNQAKEIFVWINPEICENHVKIYLPYNHQGELAMIRSIIAYLKLWFKCDYSLLSEVKSLNELYYKVEMMKGMLSEGFKPKSPQREFLANRRNSANMESGQVPQRYQGDGKGVNFLMDIKSMKDIMGRSPCKESDGPTFLTSSLSNKMSNPLKFASLNPNKPSFLGGLQVGKSEFEHRTFNNINANNNLKLNKSGGLRSESSYYPNKTTSNKNSKNHIVALINQQDTNPNEYGKNKLLLQEHKLQELQKERLRKGKESLDGIGEELNDLFHSNIQNEEEDGETLKKMEQEFSNLLE